MNIPFTDAHTHRIPPPDVLSVPDFSSLEVPPSGYDGPFSAGVHPMFARSASIPASGLEKIRSPRCLAVGECGLDRRAALSPKEQEALFRTHIELSEELCKPLIVHCVRMQPELLRLRASLAPSVPWIVHGCRGSEKKLRELADSGLILSFGEGLLRDAGTLETFFRVLPENALLIETDESETPLAVLYAAAASYRQMNPDSFRTLIFHNFRRIFYGE